MRIKYIYEESFQTYGSPRIHALLQEEGIKCSRSKVARLMKKEGIQSKMYKRVKRTTVSSKNPYYKGQDLVQQNFYAPEPNKIWVADITYIPFLDNWLYFAVILDLFSRKIVGMALQNHMKAELICDALEMGLMNRRPPKGLIHHSDLGSQYTSSSFYNLAQDHEIRLSHGKTGCAYDNAAMESFFHTLKTEWVYFKKYQSVEEAQLDIFTYIFTFYNPKRRHSTLNYLSPNQWEQRFNNSINSIYV